MKNKKILLILIYILLTFSLFFQNYDVANTVLEKNDKDDTESNLSSSNSVEFEWSRIWGSLDNEFAYDMALDSLENIYLAGYYYDAISSEDMCLVKFNSSGHYQWNRTWGGSSYDEAKAMALDSSDNIYLAGYYYDAISSEDMCLVKFNSSGHYQWNRTWGGMYDDMAWTLTLDSSDNIYLAGSTYSMVSDDDMCLVKFNSSGHYQWNRTWGGIHDQSIRSIALDSSNNIYLAGYTWNATGAIGHYVMCLVKFNSSGNYQWNRTWGIGDDDAWDIALDSSNNIYLAGFTWNTVGGTYDMCLVKFDSSGQYQWNRTFDGGGDDYANVMTLDSSDDIYLAGMTWNTVGGTCDMCLIKFDSSGHFQWNHTWDSGSGDEAYALILDSSDNIYLAGSTYNVVSGDDMCLVKFNTVPQIKIHTPIQNKFYGISAPTFNISIFDSDLSTTWYTLDGRTTNITFSGFIGTINQLEWDKRGDGMINIEFFVNDSIGSEATSEVSVYKDTTAPNSSISFTPHKGTNIVKKSTIFTLTAEDGDGSGVESIIYKINNDDWINYSDPFDLSDFKSGNFNISYYSTDKVGNIENVNSVLVKIPMPVTIPGYHIFFLISLISVISVITFKFRKKLSNS